MPLAPGLSADTPLDPRDADAGLNAKTRLDPNTGENNELNNKMEMVKR